MNIKRKSKRKKQKYCSPVFEGSLTVMLLVLLALLTSLTGCALKKQVVLHPIEQADIMLVKQGQQLTAPKDGAFLSDFYISEVMKVKVE